jgi:hypothetical protein
VRLGDNVVSSASMLVESFYGLLPSAALVLDDSQVCCSRLKLDLYSLLDSRRSSLVADQTTSTQSMSSLSCVACPAHSTISNAPRTSVKVSPDSSEPAEIARCSVAL